ncbi:MAG: VWA domain-containing protein [Thermoanaerobaculia bacterium]
MGRPTLAAGLAFGLTAFLLAAGASAADWETDRREFLDDGAGLLLGREQRAAVAAMEEPEGRRFIVGFQADPVSDTAVNELLEGVRRRLVLAHREHLSLLDERARLVFLHGAPDGREVVECGQTFVPLEIWRYDGLPHPLVLYEPEPRQAWRLWLPLDSKRVLYNREMEYWMDQWEQLRGVRPARFDLRFCPQGRTVDEATGVEALSGYSESRPDNRALHDLLEPPEDLAAWARRAAAEEVSAPTELTVDAVRVDFPERVRQRLVTRVQLDLPPNAGLGTRTVEEPVDGGVETRERTETSVVLDGVLEQEGRVFETFRVRFRRDPVPPDRPVALVFERLLRPRRDYVLHLRLTDEVTGAEAILARTVAVPATASEVAEVPLPEEAVVAFAEEVSRQRLAGRDALLLAPPEEEIVSGVWRAEALVTGERIERVVFLVDGKQQLIRTAPPFSAEVRLATVPRMQVVRAEGYDADGALVAADQVVLNQPRGEFAVTIVEPARGAEVEGRARAVAEVIVPEEKVIARVEFLVDDQPVASLTQPPWEAEIEAPGGDSVSYLAVVATLEDGSRAEDLRFLNAPRFGEQVDVDLVQLFTTVLDGSGTPIPDLERGEFEVLEEGRPVEIRRFEHVDDLPLTLGFVVDTSTSMASSLPEARRAAVAFLDHLVEPEDRVFVLTFASEPFLAAPPTDDVRAVEAALERMRSMGWTSLHDAVAAGLHVFRGARGRRAMILLTDGDDTSSSAPYRDVLEFARRSGVAVYTVGLQVSPFDLGVRKKLGRLAEETGGRAFYISHAEELAGVYDQIERELRSQYLLAYLSAGPLPDGTPRPVEVVVRGGRLRSRTTHGYTP